MPLGASIGHNQETTLMAGRDMQSGALIVSRDQVNLVVRECLLHPLVLGVFAYSAIAETVLGIRAPLAHLPFFGHLGVNLGIAALNLIILYGVLGALFHWAVLRNIPLFVTLFLLMFFIAVLEMGVISLVVTDEIVLSKLAVYLFRLTTIVGIAEILALVYFRSMLIQRLATDPDRFPVFWPTRQTRVTLQSRLPQPMRGTVLRIEALGQYVAVVTDKGRTELRLPLKDAIAELPENIGCQIHRSHWVRYDQIGAVIYQNGNPRLRLISSEVLPLGRKMVEPIKKILSARGE